LLRVIYSLFIKDYTSFKSKFETTLQHIVWRTITSFIWRIWIHFPSHNQNQMVESSTNMVWTLIIDINTFLQIYVQIKSFITLFPIILAKLSLEVFVSWTFSSSLPPLWVELKFLTYLSSNSCTTLKTIPMFVVASSSR
jgi:hypothetical protein